MKLPDSNPQVKQSSLSDLLREIERDRELRARIILDSRDPWHLLGKISSRWSYWPSSEQRARFYDKFVALAAAEPSAGLQDALLHEGRRVLKARIGSMRRDMKRLIEIGQLERMLPRENGGPR